jgi:hypothetical protein
MGCNLQTLGTALLAKEREKRKSKLPSMRYFPV